MAAGNRGVVYMGPGRVDVQVDRLSEAGARLGKCEHGVILKAVATNICGSDQHMVRGRTTAPQGLMLGHEITGEVIEAGRDVEFIKVGDLVSVPFNIACGRCRNCKEGKTGICLQRESGAPRRRLRLCRYGRMGRRPGRVRHGAVRRFQPAEVSRQATQAMAKIRDLTLLSDIFPTGYHGAVTAGVGPGIDRLRCRRGPGWTGLRRRLPFAGRGGRHRRRPDPRAPRSGEELRLRSRSTCAREATLGEQIEQIVGVPEVDCAVDCVGFEARGHGEEPARSSPRQC